MENIRLFEEFNFASVMKKLPFSQLNEDDILTHFIEKIDSNEIEVKISKPSSLGFVKLTNMFSRESPPKFLKRSDGEFIYIKLEINHPNRVRGGNFDYNNYVNQLLISYFKRFYNNYDVNIFYEIEMINPMIDPMSIINIIIQEKQINESKLNMPVEEIEDYFLELMDHENSEIPINVKVINHIVNKQGKRWVKGSANRGYKITIVYDFYDQIFVKNVVDKAINRLKRDYNIHYNQILKSGNGFTTKEIPVAGRDYTRTIQDPKWKQTITISPKKMIESKIQSFDKYYESNISESNLLIVDVQKSFSKFFTPNYLSKLKEYAQTYTNVYQVWDNHVEGHNVDKDYLYDKKPDTPSIHNDLYAFPNQKKLIEKRYNYDVDANFYKKILDEKIYKIVKEKESKKTLKRGEIFKTNEGTIIVYIGNQHVWFHCPKKLYELLLKLKGKQLTVVGGSDSECLSDVFTTCESLGVLVKRDWKYIYSATNCPIK